MNSARLASPVSGSWKAWCSRLACSSRSRQTICSRRSYSSATRGVGGQRLEQAQVAASEKSRTTPARLASIIVPTTRVSPGSMASIAWRRRAPPGSGAGAGRTGVTRATGPRGPTSARSVVGDRRVDRLHDVLASPGPSVVRSGASPSAGKSTISAISDAERLAASGPAGPRGAATISGERESVRVAS